MCDCNKCNKKEACGQKCSAIRSKQPNCYPQAIIPAVNVENYDNIKDMADCFVHVTSTNTTLYVDDNHGMIVTWAGLVSVEDYDFQENPLNLRDQVAYDAKNNIAGIYNKEGEVLLIQTAPVDNDYDILNHKPSINGTTLVGSLSLADLGIIPITNSEIDAIVA